MLCIPPYKMVEPQSNEFHVSADIYNAALKYCHDRRAILIVDPPYIWKNKDDAKKPDIGIDGTGNLLPSSRDSNAAIFFPRVRCPDPLQEGRLRTFAPCGAVAGVIARTDGQRGFWKAPAGIEATLMGVSDLEVRLTDAENGELNPLGINCLRIMPAAGRVVWGSRTMKGADRLADQWKYLPVRRTALYIEESLYRGTQWVVFEPNDDRLWGQIRLNVGTFMHDLFRKGAFQGSSPKDAYLVKCDHETTTQSDIDQGIVNILVGFAPLKPAEFVMLNIQQLAGQQEVQ
jgi:phage tail sheath protein FI